MSEEIERLYDETLALVGQELADKMYPGVGKQLAKQRAQSGGRPYLPGNDSAGSFRRRWQLERT